VKPSVNCTVRLCRAAALISKDTLNSNFANSKWHVLRRSSSLILCFPAGGLTGSKATGGGQVAAGTTLSSWVSMMPGAQALPDSIEDEEPPMPGGLNLVVMGPPLAGKSVQAQLLSDRYQLVVTTVDDLLMVSLLLLPQQQANCCDLAARSPCGNRPASCKVLLGGQCWKVQQLRTL